jgi:signal transduction histidine kinase
MKKGNKKIKKIYLKLNSNFEILLIGLLSTILLFILFKWGLSFLFITSFLIYLMIFALFLPEKFPELIKLILMGLLVLIGFIILFFWLTGNNLPYVNINLDNETIMTLFTVILAIATTISLILYRQTIGFSRLSEVDFELNKILCIEIENKGNYPARNIHLTTQIIDKNKKIKFQKKLGDIFLSPEERIEYFPSKKRKALNLREDLIKRFKLKYDEKKELYTSKVKKEFNIRIVLNYKSDTGFKNPLPIIKEYYIEINSEGTIRKEIKPYSK